MNSPQTTLRGSLIVTSLAIALLCAAGPRRADSPRERTDRETLPSRDRVDVAAPAPAIRSRRIHTERGLRAAAPQALPNVGGAWVSQGPGPCNNGQSEGITNNPVAGAIEAIIPHPTNANVIWIGAVNGGIWKTTDGGSAWTAQTDTATSLSIGAMNLDPTDATGNTIVAGAGRYSSLGRVGGPRSGVLRTTNGATWTELAGTGLASPNVSGIIARGSTIVLSADGADSFTCNNIGIWRSTDTGATFTRISGGTGTGIPLGTAFDLAGDPTNNAILYTAIRDAPFCTGGAFNGIYISTDTGATWTKVSSAAMEALMGDATGTNRVNNVRIAVGMTGEVYAGIMDNGRLAGLFRSGPGGSTWVQLDTPSTNEGGTTYGLQPDDDEAAEEAGGQGSIHFSIAADPTNANIVYVGGDRQPGSGDTGATFPNSIGAQNYSGRLFRVNAAATSGTQSTPLTHCTTATAACNSTTSTTLNSSPHADSRRIVFTAAGDLLESDDGGVFRRTNPRTTGDWTSLSGTMRITEVHDVAYDTVSNMIVGANQDNGTCEQQSAGATTWINIGSGDGGDVAVDDIGSATQSLRYTSSQNMRSFRRRSVNSAGATTASAFPSLTVTGGGPSLTGAFVTPMEINSIDPSRMIFAGSNDLYESFDRGDTITALGLNQTIVAAVAGGRASSTDNARLLYAVKGATNTVYVRTVGIAAPVATTTSPGTVGLRDVAVDPNDWHKAYVVNTSGQVFATSDTGASWTNVTGDLASGTTDLRSIIVVPTSPPWVVVGGLNGVFRMVSDTPGVWSQLGTGLSNAPVWDLDYDTADDTLVASTMGRAAWKLNPILNTGPLPSLSINDVTLTEGNSGTTNANFTVSLSTAPASTVSVNYATVDGTAVSTSTTVSSTSTITIPSVGIASPYPSTIAVAGVAGLITQMSVTLNGFTHTYAQDVDVLLVGPDGRSAVLISDVGGGLPANVRLTLLDSFTAASFLTSSALVSGTYRSTNLADNEGADAYPTPAPPDGYASSLVNFSNASPNGTWSLYVVDDVTGDSGSLSGWSLNLTTDVGDYVAQSGTLTFSPGTTTRPLSIVVRGDETGEPNETFSVVLSGPSNATIDRGTGQATITDDDVPTITNISPSSGSTSGNDSVTITGTNLANAYPVTFGGGYGNVTASSATSITVRTPAHSAGAVNVVVTKPGGTATSINGYTYGTGGPTLTNTSPSSGPTAGGQTVTINGTNLANPTLVQFGTTAATVTGSTATTITVTTPAGAAGSVNVQVTTAAGTATLTNGYTYAAAPAITNVNPASGPAAGGTTVTITGTSLGNATSVTFGGTAGAVTANSATSITVTSPAHAAGTIDVVVTTPSGNTTSTNAFTYIAAPTITTISPNIGPVGGGQTVTISGSNLINPSSVTFGGTTATVMTSTAASITVTTPAHATGAVNVVVTTVGGTVTSTNGYTYAAAPVITTIAPTVGPTSGNQTVTISGSGLANPTSVAFGSNNATVTASSAGSITVTTPANTAGTVNVVVTTVGGTTTLTNGYTYVAAPAITSLSQSSGPSAGGQAVTINGTNLSNPTAVTFGGTAATVTGSTATTVTVTTPAHSAGQVSVSVTTAGGTATLSNSYAYASAFGPPVTMTATAVTTSLVQVRWTPVTGATAFNVYRSSNGAFIPVATNVAATAFDDAAVSPNTTYLYKVETVGAAGFSPIDLATTVIFTDASLTGVVVKAVHMTELRAAVNAMRAAGGAGPMTVTDPALTGVRVKAIHITELRTALDAARTALSLANTAYTDATLSAGTTTIKAAHILELRGRMQ